MTFMDTLISVGICSLGFLAGSLPFSLWITKAIKGVDVRDSGSGHATTTNTIRQAGFGWGVLVLILDVTKGYFPTWLAMHYAPYGWAVPATAALAVVGHCWPIFAQFRGGMGLATAAGGMLAVYPFGLVVGVGIVVFLTLVIKHSARASVIGGLLFAPVFYILGERGIVLWLATALGIVLAIRFTRDWNRVYSELWLDRGSVH